MPNTNRNQAIDSQIAALEAKLRALNLWEERAPSESALLSTQPFALDTLTPTQWLQWIFIPKMTQMLASGNPLPSLEISPYFEEALKLEAYKDALLAEIYALEKTLK